MFNFERLKSLKVKKENKHTGKRIFDFKDSITRIKRYHFIMGKSKTCNGTKRNEIETKRNETERNEIVSFLVLVFICV